MEPHDEDWTFRIVFLLNDPPEASHRLQDRHGSVLLDVISMRCPPAHSEHKALAFLTSGSCNSYL